jgi:hypothetical protein
MFAFAAHLLRVKGDWLFCASQKSAIFLSMAGEQMISPYLHNGHKYGRPDYSVG